ncbi:MAG TPA: PHP domain-containing protein [Thermomicrobiales bacterium]
MAESGATANRRDPVVRSSKLAARDSNTTDLHTHSNVSDGLLSPAELVGEAARRGVMTLALTDHDTVGGLDAAATEAARLGVDFIPGIEFSTDVGPYEVHILGYELDWHQPDLLRALAELEAERMTRIERIVERLAKLDMPVSFQRVVELAGPGTVGRPHVARAMIEAGYVESVQDAFNRYLASGRPAFVPRESLVPERAIELIRLARGVPVLAHPLTTGDIEAMIQRLLPSGLLGLEVYYGEYDAATHEHLRAIADRFGLIPTGGSDYHGEGFKPGRDLGRAPVPPESVTRLREAAARLRAREDAGSPRSDETATRARLA